MEPPDLIRISAGTAAALGLQAIKTDTPPTTAYVLVGGKCRRNCAYCTQAAGSIAPPDRLSRVTWPVFTVEEVTGALAPQPPDHIRRICFQSTDSLESRSRLRLLIERFRNSVSRPLCASISASGMDEVEEILSLGVEIVGLSLDVASHRLYPNLRGGSLEGALSLLTGAALRFPGRICAHLIAGLGETEKELCQALQRLADLGVVTALFAFTPLRGTPLAGGRPPSLESYRRIQAAHHLIRNGLIRDEDLSYREGSLSGFGPVRKDLRELLSDGEAFRTTGCPGCNRPFYNEKPGSLLYNFPRPLTGEETEASLAPVIGDGRPGHLPRGRP
ncbi:MAG: radical SAM protein [Firmicutes bacterium]|nr:radical SAM protein [Bacillota bacterium]